MPRDSIRLWSSMDVQVFKSAVFPVQAKFFRLAALMLNNDEEAEDTVQRLCAYSERIATTQKTTGTWKLWLL